MRVVDLFSGAGGLSCGLHQAGMRPVAGFDHWEPALEVYANNLWVDHGRVRSISDFAKILPEILDLKPDLIAGGPPCQDFSTSGKRTEGERADRTRDFAYAICLVKPEWFIFENVPRAQVSRSYRDARKAWKAHGYGMTEIVLSAADYGVAQARSRFLCIGRLHETDGFLDDDLVSARRSTITTIRDVAADLIDDADAIYAAARYNDRQSMYSVDGHAPTIRSASIRKIPENYIDHENDATGKRVRLTREIASRIQGFPQAWEWSGLTKKIKAEDVDTMIANAVPPPLAKAVGEVIMARAAGRTQPPLLPSFMDHLLINEGLSEANAKNIIARVKRAHRILGGRSYADVERALNELERRSAFERLDKKMQSDLRTALRYYSEVHRPSPPLAPIPFKTNKFGRFGIQRSAQPTAGYMSRVAAKDRPVTAEPGRLLQMTAVRSRKPNLNAMTRPGADPTRPDPDFEDDD